MGLGGLGSHFVVSEESCERLSSVGEGGKMLGGKKTPPVPLVGVN